MREKIANNIDFSLNTKRRNGGRNGKRVEIKKKGRDLIDRKKNLKLK
jgi:hypothetical protein